MKALTKAEQRSRLDDWLDTIPDEFVNCRDLRHQWTTVGTWALGHGFRGRMLSCLRCGVRKEQVIDKTARIVVNRMTNYPDDYKKPGDAPAGRIPSTVIRDQAVRRSIRTSPTPEALVDIFDRMTKRSQI